MAGSKRTQFQLFQFQIDAALSISQRYDKYRLRPNFLHGREEPFVQLLQAITGSGKTPILARAVDDMRLLSKEEPLVLWVSKSKVIVEQTAGNLNVGGKYHHLVSKWHVHSLGDVSVAEIRDTSTPLIVTSTVASFNREDRSSLNVYDVKRDTGDTSIWDALKDRATQTPLFIVYDEGHNSTDNQIDRLVELTPKAIILSSATMELTLKLSEYARHQDYTAQAETMAAGQDPVVTWVSTDKAVDKQLIKSSIYVGGRSGTSEFIIQEMHGEFRKLEQLALKNGVDWIAPKCIYVSETNPSQQLSREDDHTLDFSKRRARPIVIWRTLVEQCGVRPEEIAVYCSLKGTTFPKEFHLYRGGDRDFANFSQGNYKHIIFNLSLQEGWDDPDCYFAYIDKEMGSRSQIKQVIGRVLRQPSARYAPEEPLNTAHFFVRFQSKKDFENILEEVRSEVNGQIPRIKIEGNFDSSVRPKPFPPKGTFTVPTMAIVKEAAALHIEQELKRFPDFQFTLDAHGEGDASDVVISTATGEIATDRLSFVKKGPGQSVSALTYLRRKLSESNPGALDVLDPSKETGKFAAIVEVGSVACEQIAQFAQKLSNIYDEWVELNPTRSGHYQIPEFQPRSSTGIIKYGNAVHRGYDGLNPDERDCAKALDAAQVTWARNPSTGYSIPLPVSRAGGRRFFPDFIVFAKDCIWLIDPKGEHLLRDALHDKLLTIPKVRGVTEIRIALIAKGEYNDNYQKLSNEGLTLFRKRSVNAHGQRCATYGECIEALLGQKTGKKRK